MEWSDDAIVLSTRRHGETAAILSVLTSAHGRYSGLVRGGAGTKARAALQTGNRIRVTWKARLSEQLGNFVWEAAEDLGTRWLDDADRLAAVAAACAMVEAALPERQTYTAAYDSLNNFLSMLNEDCWSSLYVHWEIGLLADAGFGLDLTRCAVTGVNDGLAYVSPKSGAAVSASAGEPYRDRLLPLPSFLVEHGVGKPADVLDGLRLTAYFLERHVLAAQGRAMPPARTRLVARLLP